MSEPYSRDAPESSREPHRPRRDAPDGGHWIGRRRNRYMVAAALAGGAAMALIVAGLVVGSLVLQGVGIGAGLAAMALWRLRWGWPGR